MDEENFTTAADFSNHSHYDYDNNSFADNTSYNDYDVDYSYEESAAHMEQYFLYQGYHFERIIYLYIWEILVILTCLLNVVVISVLLRKKMRSQTYMILVAISISDSLTGLVTLPTYIDVFMRYTPAVVSESSHAGNVSSVDLSNMSPEVLDYYNEMMESSNDKPVTIPPDGYILTEALCDWFMISKFFISKTFHTVSVWLTLYLGMQRFLSVYSPMRKQPGVSTVRQTLFVCISMFLIAPFLHIYHLFKDKSIDEHCKWTVNMGESCSYDCAFVWISLLLGHLLPSIALTLFTIYFVVHLSKTTKALQDIGSSKHRKHSTLSNRQNENRRASIVVVAIVVVFLIAELPYALFLSYLAISAHADIAMNLEFNRAMHATYEVMLVLSFSANFYIYTFFNQRFRKGLKETIIEPVAKFFRCKIPSMSRSLSKGSTYETNTGTMKMSEMKTFNTDTL